MGAKHGTERTESKQGKKKSAAEEAMVIHNKNVEGYVMRKPIGIADAPPPNQRLKARSNRY